jgi:predicted deacetylase
LSLLLIVLASRKVSNRGGEWMRHKWHVRSRGYLKIHVVAVDIRKKKVVSLLQVTSEEVHDSSKMLKNLVKDASENNDVKMVIIADDGAHP